MKLFILAITLGVALANDWETLRDHCDSNDDKSLSSFEFGCLFLQFDRDNDNYVSEKEFEDGWNRDGIEYDTRIPVFFMETDINGDYKIGADDMQYLMTLWDTNSDMIVSEKELNEGWSAFYKDRFHNSD